MGFNSGFRGLNHSSHAFTLSSLRVHNDVLKFTDLQKTFLEITANIESLLGGGLTDEKFLQ